MTTTSQAPENKVPDLPPDEDRQAFNHNVACQILMIGKLAVLLYQREVKKEALT